MIATFRKLLTILDPSQLRAASVLLCLMLVGMVLETLGVGLVVPALAAITDPNVGERYPLLASVALRFGADKVRFIAVVMVAMVALYLFKGLFLAFLAGYQARFVFSIEANLSRRLYAGYLAQPYTFHMQRNSALLVRNVTTGVGQFAGAIMAAATLASEFLVLLGVAALLLYAEPVGALLVGGALGGAGYSFYALTHERTLRWGAARQYHEGQRLQRLQQGLAGVRDVKILGREAQFVADYELHNVANAGVGKRQSIVTALPRLWLELMAIVGLTVLVLSMLYQGRPVATVVPTLGLFAAAAFRLMPSANKVLNALQNLRYNLPVIETLHGERALLAATAPPARGPATKPRPLIEGLRLDHVGFSYAEAQAPVLVDVCLDIPRGTSVGFVGASGAGKSTLINIVLGLLAPTTGKVLADGVDVHQALRQWQDRVGYVPQSVYLTDDTLRRNIAFGLRDEHIDEAAVIRAVAAAQLGDFVATLPEGLDTMVGERGVRLSGGQCQRIGIARALYHDPEVLVLDEASSALDNATEEAVMSAVTALRASKTVLIIAHRLSTVAQCDALYEVAAGQVRSVDKAALFNMV